MSEFQLRVPLPPPLTHDGIRFILAPTASSNSELHAEIVAAIGAALEMTLPTGDLTVDSSGAIVQIQSRFNSQDIPSLWRQAALLAGIDRSPL
jgi:hypothetical protein